MMIVGSGGMTDVVETAGVIVHRVMIVLMIGGSEVLLGKSVGPQETKMISVEEIAGGTGEVGERSGHGGRYPGQPPKRTSLGMMTDPCVDHPETGHLEMSQEDPQEVRGGVRSDTCLVSFAK